MSINNTGSNALTYIFQLIKSRYVAKVLKTGSSSAYKTLSDNDLTDALKANYDAAYTHSQSAHAPSNAEANVLEGVKVNGTALPISGKAVDVAVPVNISDLTNDSGYQTEQDALDLIEGYTRQERLLAHGDSISYLTNDAGYATESYVTAALAGITSFSFRILGAGEYDSNRKPAVTGESNKLYLVPLADAETNNAYAEWLYVNNAWEYVGQMEVDLSGYVKSTDIVELSNAQIQAIWDSVLSA